MVFNQLAEFDKDFKKLKKKYRTLENDLEIVKKVLTIEANQRPPFSLRIEGLKLETYVIKVKKIACQSLKGREKELENRDRIVNNFY